MSTREKAKKKQSHILVEPEVERITVFRCKYVFGGLEYSATSRRGIPEFKDGFWVNNYMNLSGGFDCQYWIPPSAILYVAMDYVRAEKTGGKK